ncbi:ATP-binding cassette sub-family A member 2-like isoform X2 [Ornithodoros turicata]|uniref:ATP-binding cassette sub-family A member 2-like isoform X2 n=1 Tax=Ornithodoros turicata TaxID=34597 RepID=UPI003139CEF6
MESTVQFSSIVWRMLYAKRLRRHPIIAVMEVVVPLLPFIFIEDLKQNVDESSFVNSIIYPVFTPDLEDIGFDAIYMGPDNDYCRYMKSRINQAVVGTPTIIVPEESDLVSLFMSPNISDNALGLFFKDRQHEGTISTYMDYMMLFSSGIFHFRQSMKEKPLSGPSVEQDEVSMRVTAVQAVVEMAHIMRYQNQSLGRPSEFLPLKVRRRQFPFPTYHEDADNLMFMMPLRLYFSFIFSFCVIVARIVEERASGMQGLTRLLGLSRARFWVSVYVTNMCVWLFACLLILTIMTKVEGYTGVPFLFRTEPSIVYYAMALFCSGYVLLAMLIALFFKEASFGTSFAISIWTATGLIPFLYFHWVRRSVTLYAQMSRHVKLFTAGIPLHGLYYIFRVSELYESYETTFDWPKVYTFALSKDNVSPFEIMISMGICSIICAFLLWYLEVVLPWTSTAPLPLYFPFMWSYWAPPESELQGTGSRESKTSKESEESSLAGHFEEEPRHLLLVLETNSISKKYHKKLVVNHVSIRLYQNQVFVLLGHSGSGKTTLSQMIAGLVRPSSGTAVIEGFDLMTHYLDAILDVSICPQKNVLYDELTLHEHLYYFAKIQGLTLDVLVEQIDIVVKQLRLADALKLYPRAMNCGLKRKLCMAIAVIAEPKILILDEPTAGLDVVTRHEIWEVIQKVRRTCTILLTTGDVEEADMLGDRIAIIADGSIRCCGSPGFLKTQFGTGYHLMIRKRPKVCNVDAILLVARAYIPMAQIASDAGGILRIALGVSTSECFSEMFKVLERFKPKLGIGELSVGITTMEDVYVKIASELAAQRPYQARDEDDDSDSNSIPSMEEADYESVREMCSKRALKASVLKQIRALLTKRVHYICKQWYIAVIGIVLPALLFAIEFLVVPGQTEKSHSETEFEYSLTKFFDNPGEWKAIMSTDDAMTQLSRRSYVTLIEEKAYDVLTIRDIPEYLVELGSQDFRQYSKYLVGGQFYNSASEGLVAIAWYSGEAYHTAPISMNLVHTALLRNVGNEANTDIKVTVRIAQTSLPSTRGFNLNTIYATRKLLTQVTLFGISLAILTTTFGIFPVVDRVTKSKHLQLMTGLSSGTYWFANFLFDFFCYLLSVAGMVMMFQFIHHEFVETMFSGIVTIFALYGICAIPLTYLLSFATHSTAMIVCVLIICTFFSSMMTASLYIVAEALKRDTGVHIADLVKRLSPLMSVNPPYAIVSSFLSTAQRMLLKELCESHIIEEYRYICPHPGSDVPSQDVKSEFAQYCCDRFNAVNRTRVPEVPLTFQITTSKLVLTIEAIIAFLVLAYIDSSSFGQLRTFVHTKVSKKNVVNAEMEEDVKKEESRARSLVTSRKFIKDQIGVLELTKGHKGRYAVNNISFVVRQGEILGVLGGYGAGKTTMFRLLTADVPADKGQALINTPGGIYSLRGSIKDWQSNIGYCPEHDGFLQQLTAWDMMLLFARLRGLPESIISEVVVQFIRIVDLEKIMYDRIETYSGGSRRKLSLGLALIGLPPIVVLDEPTTGMDFVSRKKIWTALKNLQAYAHTAVIMSSHSIEECEELCNRIMIMMDGQIQCLGSIPHLKAKFTQGFTMTLKTHMEFREDEEYMKKVLKTVHATFPTSKLQESYEGHLEYHLPSSSLTWSQMFSLLEFLRKKLNLLDAMLRNTTLDQIYVTLAKKEVGRRVDFDEYGEDQEDECEL